MEPPSGDDRTAREGRARLPGWAGVAIVAGLVALALILPGWVGALRATHGAVASYVALIGAANSGDLAAVGRLCSGRYFATHAPRAAKEGGVVGLPRNIHKNFQAWRDGPDVLLCPTNRVGPVYRFVREGEAWKFDGPAGVLMPGGRMIAGAGEAEGDRSP